MIVLLWLTLTGCNGLRAAPPAYTGTIEVTEIQVASAVPGRLVDVHFDEGQRVAAGDLVFELDADAVEVEVELRQAAIDMASAAVDTARTQVRAADAQVRYLSRELERVKRMEAAGVGTPQQRSTLEGQLDVARAQKAAATQQVAQAQAAQAQAEAGLKAAEERLSETQVHAAVGGVVLSRNREPGEVVAPGASVLTLGDLERPRLKIYVPLKTIETLSVGDSVEVLVDARPEEPYTGRIVKVASEAEFTPRDILTPEERVKRVFAVEIGLDPAPGLLPGVPAEARFGS